MNISQNDYIIQAKKRVKEKGVGDILQDLYYAEQILITNKKQFIKFYKLYKGEVLPDDSKNEWINDLKLTIISELSQKIVEDIDKIKRGEYFEKCISKDDEI